MSEGSTVCTVPLHRAGFLSGHTSSSRKYECHAGEWWVDRNNPPCGGISGIEAKSHSGSGSIEAGRNVGLFFHPHEPRDNCCIRIGLLHCFQHLRLRSLTLLWNVAIARRCIDTSCLQFNNEFVFERTPDAGVFADCENQDLSKAW